MPVISMDNVTKAYGIQVLLEGASVTVNDGDRIGVVGANGEGKTTLLRLLAGRTAPTRGDVHVARGTRVGFLAQEPDFSAHGTVLEAALSAFARVHELEGQLAAVHEQLAARPADTDRLLRRQGELQHEFERLGGYTCRQRAEAVLSGLGFRSDEDMGAPVEQLSGGERSRLALAHLLLQEADVLLLDEPTNHLDLAGLDWLEGFLGRFGGAAVVVSHDRCFLDGFAQRIVEIEHARVELYKGNYTAYLGLKAVRDALRRKRYDAQQARLAKEADFIQRYAAGQRGREAKGRLKRLQRVEELDAPRRRKEIHVRIQPAVRGGHEVLSIKGAGKEFAGLWLFRELTLQVLRGQRIGIVGPNGAGKTTLLRCIVGEEKLTTGTARLGHNIQLAHYRQDRMDLSPDRTVLDEVWSQAPESRAGEIRGLLGLFLFSEDDVFKTIGALSGGEQARVALARLILSCPNLLVLDEPTNHLDIPSRLCLEDALDAYEGTVLIVSHDRYLLERVADQILEVKDGRARLYQGSYSRYAGAARSAASAEAAAERRGRRPPIQPRSPRPRRKRRPLALLEKLILDREDAVANLLHAMSDPEIYKAPETVRTLTAQLEAVRAELAELYEEWEDAVDAASERR